MHDVVKWIAGSIICREFRDHELSWRIVVDDVRAERHGKHVVQSLADRARGPLLIRSPTGCCTGGWGIQLVMAGAAEGPGHASWAVATCGFPPAPSIWGPSLVRIASDSWDFLSRLFVAEMWVKSELSSCYAWQAGGDLSSGCISCSLHGNSTFPEYITFSLCLEFVRWLLGYRLRGGLDEDTWIRNTSFSPLSLLVSRSRACIWLSLSC